MSQELKPCILISVFPASWIVYAVIIDSAIRKLRKITRAERPTDD